VRTSFAGVLAWVAGCTAATPGVATSQPAESARYLALGDSFTAGTGASPARSFPARLVARWGCPVPLRNLGVNGYTTEDVIDDELPNVASFAPTLVTLAIGANDIVHGESTAVYQEHVHRILAAVVAAGVKHVVAIPQPDWSLSPVAASFGDPAALHARIVDLNAVLASETLAVGGVYIDLFPLMEQQAQSHLIARDGLHPSADAYDAWAAALARQLTTPCAPVP
jgi:acyl-CoA thioesterase-1